MNRRIPPEDHRRRGTFRPDRHDDPTSPAPDPGDISSEPPLWLTDAAAGIYRQVVGELSEEKVLRRKHLHLIALFAAMYATVQAELSQGLMPKSATITALSGLGARIGLAATDQGRLRPVAEPKPESRAEFWAKFREPREPAPVRNTRPGAKQNNGDAA